MVGGWRLLSSSVFIGSYGLRRVDYLYMCHWCWCPLIIKRHAYARSPDVRDITPDMPWRRFYALHFRHSCSDLHSFKPDLRPQDQSIRAHGGWRFCSVATPPLGACAHVNNTKLSKEESTSANIIGFWNFPPNIFQNCEMDFSKGILAKLNLQIPCVLFSKA